MEAVSFTSPRHVTWAMTSVVRQVEIQAREALDATPDWITVATVSPTGAVMSGWLNITTEVSMLRLVGTTSEFPRTRHDMVIIPGASFDMGNTFSHLNEGFPSELPVHEVPVSPFLMDRFEVTNEKALEVFTWSYSNGLISVNDVVLTNITAGGTNIVTNVNRRVTNTEGTPQILLEVNIPKSEIGFTNGIFSLLDGERTNFPVVNITWYGAMAYCAFRSDMEGLVRAVDFGPTNWSMNLDAEGFRLPTEAEWEKAMRGGFAGRHFPWPDDSVQGTNDYLWNIDPVKANYLDFRYIVNQGGQPVFTNHPTHPWFTHDLNLPPYGTTPVGYYDGNQQIDVPWMPSLKVGADFGVVEDQVNGFGLYDMSGNVYEWCYDWWGTNWYGKAEASWPDPRGEDGANRHEIMPPVGGGLPPYRVMRGGGWMPFILAFDPSYLRCAYREGRWAHFYWQSVGFRAVRSVR